MADASTPRRRAVILGAAGFIGTNLARALAERGFGLVLFDRKPSCHWPAAEVVLGDAVGVAPSILRRPSRRIDVRRNVLDVDRRQAIGWTSVHTLYDGLQKTLRWIEHADRANQGNAGL